MTNPLPTGGPQGDKAIAPVGTFPAAVPLAVIRIGDHAVLTVPGEATKEAGARFKAAVLAQLGPHGVTHAVVSGLTNEYIQYITTPAEYGQQHYEGGSTLYGTNEATFLQERYVELAKALATGGAAPAPVSQDDSFGIHANGPAYPAGAASGTITAQPPATVGRLGHATFNWSGGADGHDRPVDRAFVSAQRRVGKRWRTLETDLGLTMLWRVDASGHYRLTWEVPIAAPAGTYRFVITATRYRLTSRTFRVAPARTLIVTRVSAAPGRVAVRLGYPAPVVNVDLTARPAAASGGVVRFVVGGHSVTVRRKRGTTFSVAVPAGASVSIPAGAARDRAGNVNGSAIALS